MKYHSQENTFKDPVCGMQISFESAPEELEYEGKTYYFCASICRKTFESDPDKYVRKHRQHGMKLG